MPPKKQKASDEAPGKKVKKAKTDGSGQNDESLADAQTQAASLSASAGFGVNGEIYAQLATYWQAITDCAEFKDLETMDPFSMKCRRRDQAERELRVWG